MKGNLAKYVELDQMVPVRPVTAAERRSAVRTLCQLAVRQQVPLRELRDAVEALGLEQAP